MPAINNIDNKINLYGWLSRTQNEVGCSAFLTNDPYFLNKPNIEIAFKVDNFLKLNTF